LWLQKIGQKKYFSPSSFGAVVGSGMDRNQDSESAINIPDPHCENQKHTATVHSFNMQQTRMRMRLDTAFVGVHKPCFQSREKC
jgi:hypothetical protein